MNIIFPSCLERTEGLEPSTDRVETCDSAAELRTLNLEPHVGLPPNTLQSQPVVQPTRYEA